MDYLLNFSQGELEVEAEDEGFGPQGSKATKTKQEQQKVPKGTLRMMKQYEVLFLTILRSSPRKKRLRIVSAMLSADTAETSTLAHEREGISS